MRWIALISLVFLTSMSYGQTLTAKISSDHLGVSENFKVVYELQGNGNQFTPPSFEGFLVLAGPNKSSNMQWVNGEFSSSTTFSFLLRTTKEGTFEIGPASVTYKGKKIQSKALEVIPIYMRPKVPRPMTTRLYAPRTRWAKRPLCMKSKGRMTCALNGKNWSLSLAVGRPVMRQWRALPKKKMLEGPLRVPGV